MTYNLRNETESAGSVARARRTAMKPPRTCAIASTPFLVVPYRGRVESVNETYISYQRYRWNPTAENYDIIGENFSGLLRIGGRDTNQHMVQERLSVRNDYTRFLRWHGTHNAKGGVLLSHADYQVSK